MSAPDFLPGKASRSFMSSLPRLDAQVTLPTAQIDPRSPTIPKTPRHYNLQRSKELQKDLATQNFSHRSKILPICKFERNKKDGIESFYSGSSKNFSSSVSEYKDAAFGTNKESVQAEPHRDEMMWAGNHVSELYNAITDLQTVSSTISGRLDDTYYSILEKLSSLQSTIMSLKELATMTRQLNIRLVSECHKVAHDSNKKLDSFKNFQDQALRIRQLKNRIDNGRQNLLCLVERVRHVQKRVEGWETNEREWQKTIRKRLRIFWSCLVGISALTLLLYLLSWWVTGQVNGNSTENSIAIQIAGSQENKTVSEKDLAEPKLQTNAELLDEMNDRYYTRGFDEL